MEVLELKYTDRKLWGLNYEYANEEFLKNIPHKIEHISEAKIENMLKAIKENLNEISNLCFKNNNVCFTGKIDGKELSIVLINKDAFKNDSRFRFLFNKYKNKKYKLYKQGIKVVISLASTVVMVLSGATVVSSYTTAETGDLNNPVNQESHIKEESNINNEINIIIDEEEPIETLELEVQEQSLEKEQENIDEEKEEQQPEIISYASKEDKGFIVTTGNKTYELTDDDLELLMAVVTAESDKSLDDSLGVMTVILNRCEKSSWVDEFGPTIIDQITAKGQFAAYFEGKYKQYLNNVPTEVRIAVLDALNGVRNSTYYYFRSNESVSYSDNMITPTGNRYGNR